jgi:3-keto-disaccharide hydrolase
MNLTKFTPRDALGTNGVLLACFLLGTGLSPSASSAQLTRRQALFNGRDLAGWRQPAGKWEAVARAKLDAADNKKFALVAGRGVLVNGPEGKTSNLFTELEHGDVRAHLEFCVPKNSNSGVYFMGRYEVQILDSWGVEKDKLKFGDCGGLYASCSGEPKCYEGKAPPFNASKPPGEWQTFDVTFRAPRFDATGKKLENAKFIKVVHNGRVLHENVEVTCPTCAAAFNDEKPLGPLMLQGDHGPVAYRNLWLQPLSLN